MGRLELVWFNAVSILELEGMDRLVISLFSLIITQQNDKDVCFLLMLQKTNYTGLETVFIHKSVLIYMVIYPVVFLKYFQRLAVGQ